MTRLLEASPVSIDEAADHLRKGGLVAFPTETVYGLGASTFSEVALDAVFRLKGRPADNPLIAHVLDADMARRVVAGWDERCDHLAHRFWPGPLTLVLPRRNGVPPRASGGRSTIAVRAPRHDVARQLLEAFGGPISAPSANRSGHVSPTAASHVVEDFGDADDLIVLDGGACAVGLESTVLDLTAEPPRILRPGSVTASELAEVVDDVDVPTIRAQDASPGTGATHYAPRTPAELVPSEMLRERLDQLTRPAAVMCFDPAGVPPPHRAFTMPQGAGAYAHCLYDTLRTADRAGLAFILVERPPLSNEMWRAIHDRLRRATAVAPVG